MTEEQYNELMSLLLMLKTKVDWLEQDIAEIKTNFDDLPMIKACVEQLARQDLQKVAQEEAKRYKVERM